MAYGFILKYLKDKEATNTNKGICNVSPLGEGEVSVLDVVLGSRNLLLVAAGSASIAGEDKAEQKIKAVISEIERLGTYLVDEHQCPQMIEYRDFEETDD